MYLKYFIYLSLFIQCLNKIYEYVWHKKFDEDLQVKNVYESCLAFSIYIANLALEWLCIFSLYENAYNKKIILESKIFAKKYLKYSLYQQF